MPVVSPIIKIMAIILAGSFALSPVPREPVQAGVIGKITTKIVNTTTKTLIDKAKEDKKKANNPNYVPKKKLPIVAGFKKGRDPLPKGTNPTQTYKNIWATLKNDLGLK